MAGDTESWVLMAIVVILAIILIAGCTCTVYPKNDPVLRVRRPERRRDGVYVMPGSMAKSGARLAKSGSKLARSGSKLVRSRAAPMVRSTGYAGPPHIRKIQSMNERLDHN